MHATGAGRDARAALARDFAFRRADPDTPDMDETGVRRNQTMPVCQASQGKAGAEQRPDH